MSGALAIATAILTIFHSYVSAQAPTCLPGYNYLFNSLGQSPCTMTVALGGACVNGGFTLDPLQPGFVYLGPTTITQNSCRCSTVYYSLLSACGLCQNQTFLDWSIYDVNCSIVYTEVFTEPIPSNIVIPHYAYLDVVTSDAFNVTAAMDVGGPESSPVPQATSSTTLTISAPTSVATTSRKVDIGAIVGGVVGGVSFVGIGSGLIAFIILRKRKRFATTPSTYTAYASPQTMMSEGEMKYNSTVPTMTSGKLYDPNDPSTFPSEFPSDPVGYSTYSGSPSQRVTPTITGNATLVAVPVSARTQYTGAPEV